MTAAADNESAWLECLRCHARFPLAEIRYQCECGGLLGSERAPGWGKGVGPKLFDARLSIRAGLDASGVWRFREGVLDARPDEVVTHPEGGTRLYQRGALCDWAGVDELRFKHEGENPTGSFKDRGMTVAMTQARRLGRAPRAALRAHCTSKATGAKSRPKEERGQARGGRRREGRPASRTRRRPPPLKGRAPQSARADR